MIKDPTTVLFTSAEAMLDFLNQPSISCGDLESLARNGSVNARECGIVQVFVKEACGCRHSEDTDAPTIVPQVQVPTRGPSDSASYIRSLHFTAAFASIGAFVYLVVAS